MPHRYKDIFPPGWPVTFRPCFALFDVMRRGYSKTDLRSDLLAGTVVALVAIPLSMALAIASGVAPHNGLYTLIIAGFVVALLGGSRCQVTGPTAAFVVILAPIVHKYGLEGLLVSGLLAGLILMLMGLARLGQLIEFIPYPVTTGFTAGIAVVIASIQVKDFFGLTFPHTPESFLERLLMITSSLPSFSLPEFLVGMSTLLLLIFWPKINKKIPAPLVAIGAVTIVTQIFTTYLPGLALSTIANRFSTELNGSLVHGIPGTMPSLSLPWHTTINLEFIESLMPSAFAIAMLGAIESLLSAVVADGMTRSKHDPDAELFALGIGNLLCPFFGGIAATGAIARTATNVRYGAKSPLSAMVHSIIAVLAILFFARYVSMIPMAALAALLILVAYNMFEFKHVTHIVRVSPKSDVLVFLLCFGLTVIFDMVVGVTVGVVLASLLFMKRMAGLTTSQVLTSHSESGYTDTLPKNTIIYKIAGPLFFGAANRAVGTLEQISDGTQNVIFDLADVPAMDATGLVALESAITALKKRNICPILVNVKPQPTEVLNHAELGQRHPDLKIMKNLKEAVLALSR